MRNRWIVATLLVQHNTESLVENLSFRELNLGVLPISGVDDGLTADLGDFFPVSVEGPAADLSSANDVFHEFDSVAESDAEFVK